LGHGKRAMDAAIEGLDHLRRVALPLCQTAAQTIELLEAVATGDRDLVRPSVLALLSGPLAVSEAEDARVQAAQKLAFRLGDPAVCVRALGKDLDRPRWALPFLVARRRCLHDAGHPLAGRADADVLAFVGAAPGTVADSLPPLVAPGAATTGQVVGDR
ncbi:MAG: hypothetical protein M3O50_05530, partial [Myxococcota bacterium]|nr:hypothetical protein [Myxococcota bacterium]